MKNELFEMSLITDSAQRYAPEGICWHFMITSSNITCVISSIESVFCLLIAL